MKFQMCSKVWISHRTELNGRPFFYVLLINVYTFVYIFIMVLKYIFNKIFLLNTTSKIYYLEFHLKIQLYSLDKLLH